MLKQIFKIIWKQRSSNIWIVAELVIVSILSWYIVSYLFMQVYNRCIPDGFDTENVYLVNYTSVPDGMPSFKEEESDSVHTVENLRRFIDRIRNYPGVEGVAVGDHTHPFAGSYTGKMMIINNDTVPFEIRPFYPESDFFKVFRYTPVSGELPETLDYRNWNEKDWVMTSLSMKLHSKDSVKKPFVKRYEAKEWEEVRIAGVVNPVKRLAYEPPAELIFVPMKLTDNLSVSISVRMKSGTSEKPFFDEFNRQMATELNIGNLRFIKLIPYHQLKDDLEYSFGATNSNRSMIALLIFFMLNMALGIYGTFWLKYESRKSESGLRMAMGSSRSQLCRFYLTEGLLLATIGCMVGFIIVANLVHAELGLDRAMGLGGGEAYSIHWVYNEWLNFACCAFLTWLLIMIVVGLSVWMPAKAAATLQPAETLHEE